METILKIDVEELKKTLLQHRPMKARFKQPSKSRKNMTMTSIKIKFRPSSVEGKEGGIFFQIIHNRVVRQLNTDYRVFASEWDAEAECIIANETRANILCSIKERLAWDTTPRQRHRFTLHRWKLRWLIKPTR